MLICVRLHNQGKSHPLISEQLEDFSLHFHICVLHRHYSSALPDCFHVAGCRNYACHIRLSAFNR